VQNLREDCVLSKHPRAQQEFLRLGTKTEIQAGRHCKQRSRYGAADRFLRCPHARSPCRSEFDPFFEVCGQSRTPGGQSVVVVSPVGNLAVLDPNDRSTVHGDFPGSFESAVEGLCQGKLKSPFGNHAVTTDENRVGLQERVGIKFSCLVEEFS